MCGSFFDNYGFFGPGHNSFTRSTDDTEDLMVYHARQEERYLGEGDVNFNLFISNTTISFLLGQGKITNLI